MAVPQDIAAFVEDFYVKSDDPDHDQYCALFTPDARFLVGTVKADGRQGIRAVREGGWNNFTHRVHKHEGIYVNAKEPDVCLLTGTIDYDRKNGVTVRDLKWAGRMVFDRSDGLKVKDYHVWVVRSLCNARLADHSSIPRWAPSRRTASDRSDRLRRTRKRQVEIPSECIGYVHWYLIFVWCCSDNGGEL